MTHNFPRVYLFVILSLLFMTLPACQVAAPPTPEPSITASATAVPPTVTALASSTAVPTAMPTRTAVSPTPTATNRPPTPTAVPVATETAENVFQELISLSPDGRWQAHTLLTFVEEGGSVQGYQTDLTVTSLDGSVSWVAYSALQGAGLGYEVPRVVLWSNDNQSLFFTLNATPDGCGYLLGTYHSGLYKLDLANGEVEKLEVSGAISPDGTMVAHMVWEPEIGVQIHDLASHTSTIIAWDIALERGNSSLNLVWSPDSQAIALEFAPGLCEQTDYSLILLNLLSGEKTTLIWHELQLFSIAEWPTANEIYLRDHASEGPKWLLNIDTGERTRID